MNKTLTSARRARLERLAAYLEALPKRYKHFAMAEFLGGVRDYNALARYALQNGGVTECGTVACAVGHGPAAGVYTPSSMVRRFRKASGQYEAADIWLEYSGLFVSEIRGPGSHFEWAFGGDWSGYDNSHYGAAARIRYLLEKGDPPVGFTYGSRRWRKVYEPYRAASADTLPKGGDGEAGSVRSKGSAVPAEERADAQTPPSESPL